MLTLINGNQIVTLNFFGLFQIKVNVLMLLRIMLLVALAMTLFAVNSFAYTTDPPSLEETLGGETPVLGNFIGWYEAIYGGLVIGWGFVARAFNIKSTPNFIFVVVAGGLVIAAGFIAFGWADFFPLAISLLSSMGIYDLVFKGIGGAASGGS